MASSGSKVPPAMEVSTPSCRISEDQGPGKSLTSDEASALGCGVGAGSSGGGGGDNVDAIQKEHMFDKFLTPTDVGKLNRLVIPKQHAEKHFPLDASANARGLELSVEDSAGKLWCFRYSYWNSSQSYVVTKGWSRFVREKRLNAGDTVSFSRGAGEATRHRLFIDWKRRARARADSHSLDPRRMPSQYGARGGGPGGFFTPPPHLFGVNLDEQQWNRHQLQQTGGNMGSDTGSLLTAGMLRDLLPAARDLSDEEMLAALSHAGAMIGES